MFSVEHLNVLRRAEIEVVRSHMPVAGDVLEIGAGTGEQARVLADAGYGVSAVDLRSSEYRAARVFPVQDYDGVNLPFPTASFDVVYSSNVLEHVRDLDALQAEILRVLRPGGRCIHVLPTPAWRFWTSVTSLANAVQAHAALARTLAAPGGSGARDEPYRMRVRRAAVHAVRQTGAALLQPRHGERGNVVTELGYFSRRWWEAHFRRNGFDVVVSEPMQLFYTGYMVLGSRLSLPRRRRLARSLGSACSLFVLRPSRR